MFLKEKLSWEIDGSFRGYELMLPKLLEISNTSAPVCIPRLFLIRTFVHPKNLPDLSSTVLELHHT